MTGPATSSGVGVSGFEIPLHRALTAPILLGGAPRSIAILNGTLAGALGLGLQQWIPGLVVWVIGHSLAVFAAKRDPDFAPVLMRHLRQKGWLRC
uniref:Putative conjugal transfer TrbD transmembrane protein n=1 Tax=Caulobacter sp. (strain K31) TaxID=366602 RepID=B0T6U2_CAUSK